MCKSKWLTCVVLLFVTNGLAWGIDNDAGEKRARLSSEASQFSDEVQISVVERVIASIDGEPVTLSDLKRFVVSLGIEVDDSFVKDGERVSKYLSDMIAMRLYEREAETLGISVSETEIDAYVNEIISQNGLKEKGFVQLLGSRGLNLDQYRHQIAAEISKNRVLQTEIRAVVNVQDEDVDRYLAEHPELVADCDMVHLLQISRNIETSLNSKDRVRLREELEILASKFHNIQDWYEHRNTPITDVGYVDPAQLRAELAEVVTKLEVGETSGIIETPDSLFLIVIVEKVKSGEIQNGLRDKIQQEIQQAKIQEAMEQFVEEELPRKYHVDIRI